MKNDPYPAVCTISCFYLSRSGSASEVVTETDFQLSRIPAPPGTDSLRFLNSFSHVINIRVERVPLSYSQFLLTRDWNCSFLKACSRREIHFENGEVIFDGAILKTTFVPFMVYADG